MKKLILLILITLFSNINTVTAKEYTLNQLLEQARNNRQAYNAAKSEKSMTEKERDAAIDQQVQIEKDIDKIDSDLKQIEKDIQKLQESIEIKDKEIKEIMKFVQVSNGESAYLEYAFGAKTFTDFIYRLSVAEQLSEYNEDLIKGYNKDVKDLENKQKELTTKQAELNKKQQELAVLEAKLNTKIEELQSGIVSKEEEYKTQINLINSMKQRGCRGTDTVTTCQDRIVKSSYLVSTNGTHMPIARGYVTSDYGWRTIDGQSEFHTGIDFSNGTPGDSVYPIADGQVILLSNNPHCGNHIVYVKHNISGHSYITSYWHLGSWSVYVGQKVSVNTQIGGMAGRNTGDTCSGGVHVHVNLFDNSGNSWENRVLNGGNPNSGRINPRIVIPQTPAHGGHFSSR